MPAHGGPEGWSWFPTDMVGFWDHHIGVSPTPRWPLFNKS
jgi:hypothetical protein